MPNDAVDHIVAAWDEIAPDLDTTPMAVIGRISRLSRLIDQRLATNFAEHGIDDWMYDVLATLRRSGEPYELNPRDLVRHTMVTTGAMTNRVDRLSERGLVERLHDDIDRRRVVVRLTPAGLELVDRVAPGHYRYEATLLTALSHRDQQRLARMLRTLLCELGDVPPPTVERPDA